MSHDLLQTRRAGNSRVPRNSIAQVRSGMQRSWVTLVPDSSSAVVLQGTTFAELPDRYIERLKALEATVTLLSTWPSRILILLLCGLTVMLVLALLVIDQIRFQTARLLKPRAAGQAKTTTTVKKALNRSLS
jgi:hypothetical protein